MEKKKKQSSERSDRKTSSSFSRHEKRVLETNSVQISDDEASRLVGRIIEKGILDEPQAKPFFSPTPPPEPTVLPFPVARHRSHGPVILYFLTSFCSFGV